MKAMKIAKHPGPKCMCGDCKAAVVRRLQPTQHGTPYAYNRGCKCEVCVAAKHRMNVARYAKSKNEETA